MRHFGKAFPYQFGKFSFKYRHFKHPKDNSSWQEGFIYGAQSLEDTQVSSVWKKIFFLIILMVSFSLLLLRLFFLQVASGKENRELADGNRIQVKTIHAPRGVIYDRNGKILAQNEPGFRLVESSGSRKVSYISRDEALKMEINSDPNLSNLEVDNQRSYPEEKLTSHILGYISEITAEELGSGKFKNYKIGDRIGREGIEEIYESVLKGTDGGEIMEVDAQGRKLRSLRQTRSTAGQNIYLTIDKDLQEVLFSKLLEAVTKNKSCCGGAVAQDPKTGEILALVSLPSFNPKDISLALNDPTSPLLNRVIAGVYPPGSIFKIVSSLAGLESGKVTAETIFVDTGIINLGPYSFTNWFYTQYGKTEGNLDLIKAIKRSNDTYFYLLGEKVGEKSLGDTAKKLGLGGKLAIDLPGEVEGVVPDEVWKQKNMGEIWFPGDTLHMAIGQGFVLTTPLQLNNLISTVAADGNKFPPHLVKKIVGGDGRVIKEYKFDADEKEQFDREHIDVIKKGLKEVTAPGGTAWPFFAFPIPTAGKTGTAEYGDKDNKTHAWYSAYAPADDPQIALTVLVEGGGEGSSVAAPVAKEVFRWFLSEDKSNLIKDIYPKASESARQLGE